MALTARQRKFVNARARGATNKAAAVEAGYSAATASAAGARLAKHPAVAAEMGKIKAKAAKGKKEAPQASAPEVPPGSVALALRHKDPESFLMALMNDPEADIKLRAEAAKALMPFKHKKLGEGGKKEEAASKAGAVVSKFAPKAPPLKVVGK